MSLWDSRGNNFDFMRLGLAVLVIYSHAFPLGTGSEVHEPFKVLTHGQVTGGAIAVDSFFIMSGFLIAASARRSSGTISFLRKRAARIYPAFIVSALLTALLVVPLAGAEWSFPTAPQRLGDLLWRTLRLVEFSYRNAFAGNPYPNAINGSVWSIPYEFWCYIGVALLLMAGLLRRRTAMLVLLLSAWIVSILFQREGWILGGKLAGRILGSPQLWARLLPLYLAGVVFYLLRDRIPLSGRIAALSAVTLVAAAWFRLGWTICFPIAGTYLLLWFAFQPHLRLHRFGRFGDFSYGAYLYAFPIEQLLVKGWGGVAAPAVLFACATPLTLLLAVASWYGVERHFLAPARKKETLAHAVLE